MEATKSQLRNYISYLLKEGLVGEGYNEAMFSDKAIVEINPSESAELQGFLKINT